MEFLKNPQFTVALALKNQRSADSWQRFAAMAAQREACFTPVLGLHNCPATLALLASGEFAPQNGEFTTHGFITAEHELVHDAGGLFRVGVERIPTFQNDDFWNLPERYRNVAYPSESRTITARGEYYRFTDGSQWTLI
jgi:hypothetical protein